MSGTIVGFYRVGLAALMLAAPVAPVAAVVLTTPIYTQNFDTLANSGTSAILPSGWSILETGSSANTTYAAGTGSINTGNTYSFGAAGSTERALGGLASASLTPLSFGVQLTNGLDKAITSLNIDYYGELWRIGTTGNLNRLSFSWSVDATSLNSGTYTNFSALDYVVTPTGPNGATNGNLNRNLITSKLSGLGLLPGSSIFLRWTAVDSVNLDHGMAIDDVAITASTVLPEPGSWAMLIAGFGLVGAVVRRRRALGVLHTA